MARRKVTLFTVASKNYLAHVRVLLASVAAQHPDFSLYLCLADHAEPEFDAGAEPYSVVQADALDIPGFGDMVLRYDIMELNTAVKPWMVRWLFAHTDSDVVIYLDPDIRVYAPMQPVLSCFDNGASVVLTPHITRPLEDGRTPNDHHMLQAGVFNLGFIALSRSHDAQGFNDWWSRRMLTQALSNPAGNLFTDQRWCDLAPCFVDKLSVLKHPGCNVAYWNLSERVVEPGTDGRHQVNGQPLVFFHYSGTNAARPQVLSKHQNRHSFDTHPALRPLFDEYYAELRARGLETVSGWTYAWARHDGVPMSALMRAMYRRIHPEPAQAGAGDWLARAHQTEPGMPVDEPWRVTRLMRLLHDLRPDLQAAFGLGSAEGREGYSRWFAQAGAAEAGVPPELVPAPASARTVAGTVMPHLPGPGGARASSPDVARQHLVEAWSHLNESARQSLAPAWRDMMRILGKEPQPGGTVDGLPADTTPVMRMVWASRPDLQAAFDIRNLSGLRAYHDWFRAGAAAEYGPYIAAVTPVDGARGRTAQAERGANLVGYAHAEMGMGEHVRMTAAALRTTDVAFGVVNVRPAPAHREHARLEHGRMIERPQYRANVLHVNADQMLSLYGRHGPALYEGRYNIGYWAWELSRWPRAWAPALDLVQEVWAPSRFIADCVGAAARLPVVHMPLCVALPEIDPRLDRPHFGLDPDAFHFLFAFDFLSYPERKNPMATVRAFGIAFPRGDEAARLVVKTMNAPDGGPGWREISAAAQADPRIVLVNRTMSRREVVSLTACCDAFVSLHRAEGFGRGPAEAMALGRPVVVTAYSGSMDYTTPETACLVDYRLVPVPDGAYPMHEGQVWAEPDVEHAAEQMRWLYDNPGAGLAMGARAREHIERNFGEAAIGSRYAARLHELDLA